MTTTECEQNSGHFYGLDIFIYGMYYQLRMCIAAKPLSPACAGGVGECQWPVASSPPLLHPGDPQTHRLWVALSESPNSSTDSTNPHRIAMQTAHLSVITHTTEPLLAKIIHLLAFDLQ